MKEEHPKFTLQVLSLTKQYMNISAVMKAIYAATNGISDNLEINEITTGSEDKTVHAIEITVPVIPDKNIKTTVRLCTDPETGLIPKLTPFDIAVLDSVYTIVTNSGSMAVTTDYIQKTLSLEQNQRETPKKTQRIMDSLETLGRIRIEIDCSEECRARRIMDHCGTFSGNLLELGNPFITTFHVNGKPVKVFPLKNIPVTHQYAEMINQIIGFPADLLYTDKGGKINITIDAMVIRRYVVRRVLQIIDRSPKSRLRNKKLSLLWENNHRILKGLFAELGYTPDTSVKWRTKVKPRIVKVVKDTLNILCDKQYISYHEYRADGTKNPASPVMGYEITPKCSFKS